MTTLAHERAGVISLAARAERDIRTQVEARLAATADPVQRDELVGRWVEARLLGLLGERSLSGLDRGLEPGPEHSVIKLAWSLTSIRAAATHLQTAGPTAMLGSEPAATKFLQSPAAAIAAGTTEIMKNVLAERVLGLPR